jgi:hypothetical protein
MAASGPPMTPDGQNASGGLAEDRLKVKSRYDEPFARTSAIGNQRIPVAVEGKFPLRFQAVTRVSFLFLIFLLIFP